MIMLLFFILAAKVDGQGYTISSSTPDQVTRAIYSDAIFEMSLNISGIGRQFVFKIRELPDNPRLFTAPHDAIVCEFMNSSSLVGWSCNRADTTFFRLPTNYEVTISPSPSRLFISITNVTMADNGLEIFYFYNSVEIHKTTLTVSECPKCDSGGVIASYSVSPCGLNCEGIFSCNTSMNYYAAVSNETCLENTTWSSSGTCFSCNSVTTRAAVISSAPATDLDATTTPALSSAPTADVGTAIVPATTSAPITALGVNITTIVVATPSGINYTSSSNITRTSMAITTLAETETNNSNLEKQTTELKTTMSMTQVTDIDNASQAMTTLEIITPAENIINNSTSTLEVQARTNATITRSAVKRRNLIATSPNRIVTVTAQFVTVDVIQGQSTKSIDDVSSTISRAIGANGNFEVNISSSKLLRSIALPVTWTMRQQGIDYVFYKCEPSTFTHAWSCKYEQNELVDMSRLSKSYDITLVNTNTRFSVTLSDLRENENGTLIIMAYGNEPLKAVKNVIRECEKCESVGMLSVYSRSPCGVNCTASFSCDIDNYIYQAEEHVCLETGYWSTNYSCLICVPKGHAADLIDDSNLGQRTATVTGFETTAWIGGALLVMISVFALAVYMRGGIKQKNSDVNDMKETLQSILPATCSQAGGVHQTSIISVLPSLSITHMRLPHNYSTLPDEADMSKQITADDGPHP